MIFFWKSIFCNSFFSKYDIFTLKNNIIERKKILFQFKYYLYFWWKFGNRLNHHQSSLSLNIFPTVHGLLNFFIILGQMFVAIVRYLWSKLCTLVKLIQYIGKWSFSSGWWWLVETKYFEAEKFLGWHHYLTAA